MKMKEKSRDSLFSNVHEVAYHDLRCIPRMTNIAIESSGKNHFDMPEFPNGRDTTILDSHALIVSKESMHETTSASLLLTSVL